MIDGSAKVGLFLMIASAVICILLGLAIFSILSLWPTPLWLKIVCTIAPAGFLTIWWMR